MADLDSRFIFGLNSIDPMTNSNTFYLSSVGYYHMIFWVTSKFLAFLVLSNNMEVLIMQWSKKSSLNCLVFTNFMFHLMQVFLSFFFGHEIKTSLGKCVCVYMRVYICMWICVCVCGCVHACKGLCVCVCVSFWKLGAFYLTSLRYSGAQLWKLQVVALTVQIFLIFFFLSELWVLQSWCTVPCSY